MKILIVDNSKVFRYYLKEILSKLPDMDIVGLAENGEVAVELVRKLKPDAILMDVKMPVMNGFEATKQIKTEFPEIKVIAFSSCFESEVIKQMLKAGASKYLLKGDSSTKIVEAIKEIHNDMTNPQTPYVLVPNKTTRLLF